MSRSNKKIRCKLQREEGVCCILCGRLSVHHLNLSGCKKLNTTAGTVLITEKWHRLINKLEAYDSHNMEIINEFFREEKKLIKQVVK